MTYNWTKYQSISEMMLTRKYRFNKETLNYLFSIMKISPTSVVADIGCGMGHLTREVCDNTLSHGLIIGVDLDFSLLKSGREILFGDSPPDDLILVQGNACRLPIADNSLDAAYCITLLHAVSEPLHALLEMKRITKPGGYVSIIDGHCRIPQSGLAVETIPSYDFELEEELNRVISKIDDAWVAEVYSKNSRSSNPAFYKDGKIDILEIIRCASFDSLEINGVFSKFPLCDNCLSKDQIVEYLELYFHYIDKLVKTEYAAVREVAGPNDPFSETDIEEFERLLQEKKNHVFSNIEKVKADIRNSGVLFMVYTLKKN